MSAQTGLLDTTLTPLPQPATQQKLSSTTTTTITTTAAHTDSQLSATPQAEAITQVSPTLKTFHKTGLSESGLTCYHNNAYVLRVASLSEAIMFGNNRILVTTADISPGDGEVTYWTLMDAGNPSRQLQLDATGGLFHSSSDVVRNYFGSMSFKLTPTETAANVSDIALDRHYTADIILEDSPERELPRDPANEVVVSGVRYQRFHADLYKVTLTAITDNAVLAELRYTHPIYMYDLVMGTLLPIRTDISSKKEKGQHMESVQPMPLSVQPSPGLETASPISVPNDMMTFSLSEDISPIRSPHLNTSSFQTVVNDSTLPKIVKVYSMSTSHRTLVTPPLPTEESTVSTVEQVPSVQESYNLSKNEPQQEFPFMEDIQSEFCATTLLRPTRKTSSAWPDASSFRDVETTTVATSAATAPEGSIVASVSDRVITHSPVLVTLPPSQVLNMVTPDRQSNPLTSQNVTPKRHIDKMSREVLFKSSSVTPVLSVSQSKNGKSCSHDCSVLSVMKTSVNAQESSALTNVMKDIPVGLGVSWMQVEKSLCLEESEAMELVPASLSTRVVTPGKEVPVNFLDSDKYVSNFPAEIEYVENERKFLEPSDVVLPTSTVGTQNTDEMQTDFSTQLEKRGENKKSMEVKELESSQTVVSLEYSKATELNELAIKEPKPFENTGMIDVHLLSEAGEPTKEEKTIEIVAIEMEKSTETDEPIQTEMKEHTGTEKLTQMLKPKQIVESTETEERTEIEAPTETEDLEMEVHTKTEGTTEMKQFTKKEKSLIIRDSTEIKVHTETKKQMELQDSKEIEKLRETVKPKRIGELHQIEEFPEKEEPKGMEKLTKNDRNSTMENFTEINEPTEKQRTTKIEEPKEIQESTAMEQMEVEKSKEIEAPKVTEETKIEEPKEIENSAETKEMETEEPKDIDDSTETEGPTEMEKLTKTKKPLLISDSTQIKVLTDTETEAGMQEPKEIEESTEREVPKDVVEPTETENSIKKAAAKEIQEPTATEQSTQLKEPTENEELINKKKSSTLSDSTEILQNLAQQTSSSITTAEHTDSQLSTMASSSAKAITQVSPVLKTLYKIRPNESGLMCYPNNAYVLRVTSLSDALPFGDNRILVTTADIEPGYGEVLYWTLGEAGKPPRQLWLNATGGLCTSQSECFLNRASVSSQPIPTKTAASVSDITLERHYTTDIILEDFPECKLPLDSADKVVTSGVRYQRFGADTYKVTLTGITDRCILNELRYSHPIYAYDFNTFKLLPVRTNSLPKKENDHFFKNVRPMPLSMRTSPDLQTTPPLCIPTDKTVSLSEVISPIKSSHLSTPSSQAVVKESQLAIGKAKGKKMPIVKVYSMSTLHRKESQLPIGKAKGKKMQIVKVYSMSTLHRKMLEPPLPTVKSTLSPVEQAPPFLGSFNTGLPDTTLTPLPQPPTQQKLSSTTTTTITTTAAHKDSQLSATPRAKAITQMFPTLKPFHNIRRSESGLKCYPNNAYVLRIASGSKPIVFGFNSIFVTTADISTGDGEVSYWTLVDAGKPSRQLQLDATGGLSLLKSNDSLGYSRSMSFKLTPIKTSKSFKPTPTETAANVSEIALDRHYTTDIILEDSPEPDLLREPANKVIISGVRFQRFRANLYKVTLTAITDNAELKKLRYTHPLYEYNRVTGSLLPIDTDTILEQEKEQNIEKVLPMPLSVRPPPGLQTMSQSGILTDKKTVSLSEIISSMRLSHSSTSSFQNVAKESTLPKIVEAYSMSTSHRTLVTTPLPTESTVSPIEQMPSFLQSYNASKEKTPKGVPFVEYSKEKNCKTIYLPPIQNTTSCRPDECSSRDEVTKMVTLSAPQASEVSVVTSVSSGVTTYRPVIMTNQVLDLVAPNPQSGTQKVQNATVSKCGIVEISRNKPQKEMFKDSSATTVLPVSQSKNVKSPTKTVSIAQPKLNTNVTNNSLYISNEHMSFSTYVDLTETDVSTDVTGELPQRKYLSDLMTSPPSKTSASVNPQESSAHTNVMTDTTVSPSVFSVPVEVSPHVKKAEAMQHMRASLSMHVVAAPMFGKVGTVICLDSDEEDSNFPLQMEYAGNERRLPEPSGVVLPGPSVNTQKTNEIETEQSFQIEKLGKRKKSMDVEDSDAPGAATSSVYSKPTELEVLTIKQPMPYERKSMSDVEVMSEADELSKDAIIEILVIQTDNPTEIGKPKHMEKSIKIKEPVIMEKCTEIEELNKKGKPSEKPSIVRDFTEKEKPTELQGPNEIMMITLPSTQVLNLAAPNPQLAPMTAQNVSVSKCSIVEISRNKPHKKLFVDSSPSPVLSISQSKNATSSTITVSIAQTKLNSNVTSDSLCISNQHMSLSTCVDLTETDVSTDVTVELPQRRYLSCLMTSPPFNTSASVNAQESSAHTNVVKNTTVGPSVFSVPLEMSHRAKEAQGMQHMGASLSINVVDPHTFGKVDTAICLVSDEEDSNFPSQMEYVGNKRRFPEPSGVVLPALSVSTQKTDETQMKYSIQVEKLGKRTESTIVEESDASEAATYSEYSKPSELEGLTIEAPMVYERASMNDVNVLNDAEEPSKEDEMIEILQIETENPTEIAKPMHMEKSIEMKEPIITRKNTGMGEIKQSREIEKFAEMEEFYKKEKTSEKPPTIRDFTEKEEPAKLQGPKIKEPSEREEWEMEEPTETKGPTKMVEPAKKEKPSIARDTTEMKEPTETETPTDMQELKDIEKLTEAEKRIQIGGLEKLEGSTETDESTEMEELTKKNKHSAIRDSTEIKEPMEIIKNMKMSANQSEKSIKMEELTKKEKPLTIKYSTERKEPTDTENPAEMQEPNEIEKPKANENPTRIGVLKQIKESQKTEAPSQMEQHTKNGESSTMKASTITKELTGMQDPIETEDTDIEETKKLEEPTETEGPMEMEQLTKKKNPLIIRHFREIKDSTETIKATGTHYPKEIEEPTEIEAMEMETLKNVEEPKEPKKIMEMEEPKKIGEHSETEPSAEVVELKQIEELTETEGPTEIEQLTITEKVLIIRDSTEIKAFTGTKKKQGMKPPKEIEELTKPEFTEMEASIDIEGTTETKKSMEMKEPKEKGKPFKTEQPTEMEEYKEIKEPTETEEPMKIEKLTNKEKPSTISDSTEIIPLLPQPPSPQALSFTTAAEHTDTKLSATEGSRNKVITQVPSSLKTLHKIKSDSGRACYPNNAYVLRLTSLSKAITFGENSILVTTADISPGNGEVSYWTLVQAGKPPRQLWLDGTGGLCPSQSNNIIDVTSKLTPTEAAANVSDITLDRKYTTNVILEDSPERELPRYPADKVVHAGVRYQRFGADTYKLTLTAITDRAVMRELCYKNFLYSYNIETGKLLCIRTDSTSKWYKGKCQKLQSGILTDKKTDSQSEIISSMTLSRLSTSSFQAVAKESTLPKIVEAYSMSTSHRTLVTMPLPTAESTVSPVEQSRPLLQSYNARRRTRRTEEQRYAYALIENFTQNMSLSKLNPRDVIMTTVTPSASPAPEGSVVTSISASVTTHRPVMASTEVFDLVAPDVQSDPLTTQNVRVSTRGISNISRNKPQNKLKFKDFSTALLQSKNAKSFTKTISIAQPKVNSNVTDNPLCISNQHMSFSTYVDLTETDTSTKVTVDLPQGSSSSNLKTFSPPNTSASWSSRQDHSGLSAVNTSLNTQPQEQESLAHTNIMKYTSVSPCVSSMPVEKSSCSQEAEAVELMRASMSNT